MDELFIDQRPPLYRRLRTNLQQPAPKDDRKHSKLASTLLEQWAWGEIAAPLLQQLASAAVADGALHPQLISLSKLGHNGQCPGNCHRDLQRYLSGSDTMSVPVNMAITLDISGDKVDTELPLMPLHRVWSCMFHQRKDIFDVRVRGARWGHQKLLGGAEQDRPKMDCMVKAFERQANDPLHTVCSARRWSASVQGKKPLCAQWLFYFGKWHQHRCENVDDMLLEPHEEQEP